MRSPYAHLISLIFLCTACSTHDSSQGPASPALQSNIVLSDEKPANFEKAEDLYHYLDAIIKDLIDHKDDPSVEIAQFPKNDLTEISSSDSQETIAYTLLTFKEFPGDPPYSIYSRRLLQEDPNAFLPQPFQETLCNAICGKNKTIPFTVALFPNGFLPGERVTWRLCGTDQAIFKEGTLCPRPMILKDKSGKVILEAALLSIHDSMFCYLLYFPARDEVVEFISTSGEEVIKEIFPLNNSVSMNYLPAVKGIKSGVSQIEIRFLKDGSSYKMAFPWGTALLNYSVPS